MADSEHRNTDDSRPGVRQAMVVAAAQQERHDLMAAEIAAHVSNAQDELRRHQAALEHIERVYRLRTGQPEPAQEGERGSG